ncbi:uncharacterized protein F5891DRAFT_1020515 [Suillus fuscotomentosus]|uniref:Secreted protein n=1 Tax=Suillus fuscotomentosus TaxID=1912939 RepID=A0AAD4HPT8_9AGAM|nr:uncharacterized protein F5891DRAFT_1020515 [Suillus fuscotomentosus]KAG1903104.1 hypothetical protein F5891DRAFT_1020515 [Suillus fuscotomentosus]
MIRKSALWEAVLWKIALGLPSTRPGGLSSKIHHVRIRCQCLNHVAPSLDIHAVHMKSHPFQSAMILNTPFECRLSYRYLADSSALSVRM